MDKLRKKVFWVIFLILTIFTTSVFVVYNFQQYNGERLEIVRNFTQIERFDKREDFPGGEKPPQMPEEPEEKDFKNMLGYLNKSF